MTEVITISQSNIFEATTHGDIADELGKVRAQMKALKTKQEFLEDLLKNQHVEAADGQNYHVEIAYDVQRKSTAWKKVAEHFKPSRQLLAAHSTTSTFDRVVVTAHNKGK